MRLTLPVLLDYLDQRLDPAVAAEVEDRLERDPAAQALLQRAKQALEQTHRRAAGPTPAPTTWAGYVAAAAPTLLLLAALCAIIFFGAWWFDAAWSSPPEDAPPDLHPAIRTTTEVGTDATSDALAQSQPTTAEEPDSVAAAAVGTPAAPRTPRAEIDPASVVSSANAANPRSPGRDPRDARPAETGADAGRRANAVAQRPTPKLTGVRRVDGVPIATNSTPRATRDPAVRPASLESPADPTAAPSNDPAACATAAFATADDALVRYDAEARVWQLTAAGEPIAAGRLLLAPPNACARLLLRGGLVADLQPETLVELESRGPREPPTLRIWFGRVRLDAARDGRLATIAAGVWSAPLSFSTAGAIASIEVRPFTRPGVDPRATAEERAITIRVARGAISLGGEASGSAHAAPTRVVVVPHPLDPPNGGEITDAPPAWSAAREPLSVEDQRVLTIVRERTAGESSLLTALGKLVHERNPAVRHAAAHWLACLGDFGPLVKELSEEDLLVLRRDESVAALARATARGPLWAKRVEHALLVERGATGRDLFRMLWRYSPDQLREGASVQLVERLDHPDLDVRTLAFWNLQTLTGVGLHYRPELPTLQRKPLVDRWKERLALEQLAPAAR